MSRVVAKASSRELPEPGVYPARVVRIIELGSVETDFGTKFKIQLVYELIGEFFENEEGEEFPQTVFRNYNKSLGKSSDMGKDVRAITGIDFDADEEYELDDLLDSPCQVEVVHSEDGKYANVNKVIGPPKGGKIGRAVSELKSLYLDENFDEDVYESLHSNLQKKIAESPEYQEIVEDSKPKSKKGKGTRSEEDDDEPKSKRRGKEDDDEDDKPRRSSRDEKKKPARRRR